jgi:hypothetical protein
MDCPWSFGWTQLLTIIGLLITITIAIGGFRTFERWRKEKLEEKRIDIAIEALALRSAVGPVIVAPGVGGVLVVDLDDGRLAGGRCVGRGGGRGRARRLIRKGGGGGRGRETGRRICNARGVGLAQHGGELVLVTHRGLWSLGPSVMQSFCTSISFPVAR